MIRPMFALLALSIASLAAADTVDRPTIKAGDSWIYRVTSEKGPGTWAQSRDELTVTRVTGTTIFFNIKAAGSSQPPRDLFMGADWSRSRDVNGKETVVNRPLSFPLTVGKSWDLSFTELNPTKTHQSEKREIRLQVVGMEEVEVPAGRFQALKIEGEGHWTAELAPGQTVTQGAQTSDAGTTMVTEVKRNGSGETTGRIYHAYWYAPQAKRWIKAIEEYYSSGGVRSERTTQELESYKFAE